MSQTSMFFMIWLSVLVVVLGARGVESWLWRRSLVAFQIQLPGGLDVENVAAWLSTVQASTYASRVGLLHNPPMVVEILATRTGIAHVVLVPAGMQTAVIAGLQASLGGVRVQEAPDYLTTRPRLRVAVQVRMTSGRRPLAVERATATNAAFLAALQPLHGGEEVRVQWIITGARIPPVVRTPPRQGQQHMPWWLENQAPPDADEVQAQRAKHRHLLLHATVRIGIAAPSRGRAYNLFGRVWGPLRMLNAPGVKVVRRRWLPPGLAAVRVRRVGLPWRWPLLLNTREAAALIGLPLGQLHVPGLTVGGCRQLPPPAAMPRRGTVVALSNYPGTQQALVLQASDRLRHTWMIGPIGVGKSTLLAQLICQDMDAGAGMMVIDPRNDLITDVLARVPEHRRNDVIICDPTDTTHPVGFNILRIGRGEHGRELAVDHVLHIMADLYKSSWGPRTADVLRAGLLTLTTTTPAHGGDAFTLCELPELLTNPTFRHAVVTQRGLPAGVRPFWQWYEALSDPERTQVIGPVLNKLRTFTLKTPLRLMLGQAAGLDLHDIFTKRRIVLVPLSKGIVGTETAQLLGALLVASFWQVTLGRVRVPAAQRRPVWLYIDEFQDVLRLPLDVADMLAQARALGVGLTLAHQHLGQLPEAVKTAVRSTTRTHITFQLNYDDAKALTRSFAPLGAEELMALRRHEIAIRPCVDNQVLTPITGTTRPLPAPTTDTTVLAADSRQRYGTARADVETALTARITTAHSQVKIGRSPRGSQPEPGQP